jgi:cardiolipin synthase
MATGGNRKRALTGLTCEGLEGRQLLSAVIPTARAAEVHDLHSSHLQPKQSSLFIEPQDGRGPILQAINSARSEIRLGICNLSDPQIGDALAAAVARGVDVKVIVDQADYHAKPAEQQEIAILIGQHVSVHLSNAVFPQSFEKELVIDQREVLIMTMCLVPVTFQDTRDYGLIVTNRSIIREVTSVYNTDWAYSAPPGGATPAFNPTPPIHDPNLIWGPTDATAKLSQLIQTARHSINATSELLNDPYLEGQLIAAAQRGVKVRLIVPLVPRDSASSAPQIAFLNSQGVKVHVTTDQSPPPGVMPYMHAKTMVVDGRTAYLGSIDLDTTEASQDRELGILFQDRTPVRQLNAQFQSDWNRTQTPPA